MKVESDRLVVRMPGQHVLTLTNDELARREELEKMKGGGK